MDEVEIRRRLIAQFGIRIEPEMSRYVLDKLKTGAGEIPIMGGDARTGVPVRTLVNLEAAAHKNPADS
jgi:hypothetical protein